MKGLRLVLIACVIMLSFAGVGYSAWTEGLNIKSLFVTGNIHIVFEDPEIVSNELDVINVDANEGVLTIEGTVAPGSKVSVKYDIYNDSSIPVKYNPDVDALPEGITLDQNDTVIGPGEYLRGNQLTIEPGENELILPFVQYNSKESSGWEEEITIRWNITVVEEPVILELDITSEDAITIETPIEVIPPVEEPIVDDPPIAEPIEDALPPENPAEDVPPPENPTADVPPPENPIEDVPSDDPVINENLAEDNTESDEGIDEGIDEGTDENVTGGEK